MGKSIKKIIIVFSIVFIAISIGLIGCGSNGDKSGNNGSPKYYTVTFDSRGGSAVSSKQVLSGNLVAKPTAPFREGYCLTGWFTIDGDEWHFDTDKVYGDITLYAGWSTSDESLENEEITTMFITINGNKLAVKLEKNSSVDALVELLKHGDMVYTADDYGNFEKVGSLGHSLPTNNSNITASAGDVILYSGNQIVLFYGSNSWSYTRLGKIEGYTASQLRELLGAGKGAMSVTLSLS
ncbi:MAG: InlB B-repeat-containing protein [Clostridiales bacterium]|nr:InlB B-repeat-containing protein [Clostridiales bacterium]